jgi:hypothetical protein
MSNFSFWAFFRAIKIVILVPSWQLQQTVVPEFPVVKKFELQFYILNLFLL